MWSSHQHQCQTPGGPPAIIVGMGEAEVPTLALRLYGHPTYPCPACRRQMVWIVGLQPVHNPKADELVTCDKVGSVAVAAEMLRGGRLSDLAKRLRPRQARESGASHNANVCAVCGYQPDWYEYDQMVNAALHGEAVELTRGRIARDTWRKIKNERNYVIGWL